MLAGRPIFGVDVSSNNPHPINWPALFSALKGAGLGATPLAIVKISQGTGYVNPDAGEDLAVAKAAGFVVGGYLMDQGNADPAAEEAIFRAHISGVPQFDDDELPEGLSTGAYIAHLESLVAQDPAAPQYLNQSEEGAGYRPGRESGRPTTGRPGVVHRTGVLIHQYTSSATVPGCAWVCSTSTAGWGQKRNSVSSSEHFQEVGRWAIFPMRSGPSWTADGNGAWVVASDGGVFTAGDAQFYGVARREGHHQHRRDLPLMGRQWVLPVGCRRRRVRLRRCDRAAGANELPRPPTRRP